MQETENLNNTPSELVKVFSAYVQAQAASLNKPTLPEKVMECVLRRFDQANSRTTPRSALITSLIEMYIVPPDLGAKSAKSDEQVTQAAERIVNSTMELPPRVDTQMMKRERA